MIKIPTTDDLEKLAIDAGITVSEACVRARVSPHVFGRWKRMVREGKQADGPGIENIRKIVNQLQIAVAERVR